jgi:enamine deaminase RidA (YjgF/YER057c/UK114 family)
METTCALPVALNMPQFHSEAERTEMTKLGIVDRHGCETPQWKPLTGSTQRVERCAIEAPDILNEAYEYARPSSFTRGLRINMGAVTMLLISGTASIDDEGRTVHVGDFRAQLWRTYRNITRLLESEGADWKDIVRTSCYLRDIERDYKDFNEVRTEFFTWLKLDPLPASTGIQARLCREDLLVEIEAIAVLPAGR